MDFKEKMKTIGKIFLLVVVPQIITIGSVLSIAYWGYMLSYIGVIPMLFVAAGGIALLFLYISIAVMLDNYLPSVFGLVGVFANGFSGGEGSTEVIIREGRTSSLTGETHYYVETRNSGGGGVFILAAIKALLLCAFGMVWFVLESIIIIFSDDRQYEWDDAFDDFSSAMNWEDMKVPAISLLVILVGWVVVGPNLLIVNYNYNPDNIEITASEIKDLEYNYSQGVEFTVDLSIKNNGKGPIEHIDAYFYVTNSNGDIVSKTSGTLKAAFCDPDYDFLDEEGKYLVNDKEWSTSWEIFIDADEWDITEFIDADASELNLYYDLREVRYKDDNFFHYEAEEKAVKIEATGSN